EKPRRSGARYLGSGRENPLGGRGEIIAQPTAPLMVLIVRNPYRRLRIARLYRSQAGRPRSTVPGLVTAPVAAPAPAPIAAPVPAPTGPPATPPTAAPVPAPIAAPLSARSPRDSPHATSPTEIPAIANP